MKSITKNRFAAIVFFLIFYLGVNHSGICQPGDPGGDDDVPITGIEWLLLAGGGLGARKVFVRFRKGKPF